MLGVFGRDLKKPDQLVTELPGHTYIPAMKDGYLERFFTMHERSVPVIVSFGTYGFMGYSVDEKISPSPGPVFSMKDGICCVYRGGTQAKKGRENAGQGRNEVDHLIACYKDLKRSNGYANPYKMMEFWCGDYNYILYDSSVGDGGGAFVVHCWDAMPVYYGLDSYGFCVITDQFDTVTKVCGESFMPISRGTGILIPVLVEIKVEPVTYDSFFISDQNKESAGKAIEANSSGLSRSAVIDLSKVESIKTSGGEAVAVSPSGVRSSKKGSGEKRNAASSSGARMSKKGRD